jgi:hypothetical protein
MFHKTSAGLIPLNENLIQFNQEKNTKLEIYNFPKVVLPNTIELYCYPGIWKHIQNINKDEYVGLHWNKDIHVVTKKILEETLQAIHEDNIGKLKQIKLDTFDVESLLIVFQNIRLSALGRNTAYYIYLCFQSNGLVLFSKDGERLQPEDIKENTQSVGDRMFLKVFNVNQVDEKCLELGQFKEQEELKENKLKENNINGLLVRV